MVTLILHDRRLMGATPTNGTESLLVNGAWGSIDKIVAWIRDCAEKHGRIDQLKVMCHGYNNGRHEGGFGLELGPEGLSTRNVYKFALIHGKVREIVIYSCGTAKIAEYQSYDGGDGNQLCSLLAMWAGAYVTAAVETQYYHRGFFSDQIDFGDWEGMVLRYTPGGNCVVAQEG